MPWTSSSPCASSVRMSVIPSSVGRESSIQVAVRRSQVALIYPVATCDLRLGLVHLRAEMSGRVDRAAAVAADLPPLGDDLRGMLADRAHLLAGRAEARGRGGLALVLLHALHHQDDHVALGIVADAHL